MIEGSLAVALNIFTIAIITFVVANLVISGLVRFGGISVSSLQLSPRRSLLWVLVLTPWIVAVCVASVFYMGYVHGGELFGQGTDVIHWHHMATHYWMSWHTVVLLLASAFVLKVALSLGVKLYKHHGELQALTHLASHSRQHIYEVDSPRPFAFTSGFFRKRCFMSSGLMEHMSLAEQDVVLQHEMAHIAHNDPLKKWLFSIFAEFFLATVATELKHQMTLAMEQDADSASILANHEPTFVALTLVKMARISQEISPVQNNEFVANFAAEALEQRVHFLLGQLQLKPVNKLSLSGVSLAVMALCISSVDSIHHVMDLLFIHSGAIS